MDVVAQNSDTSQSEYTLIAKSHGDEKCNLAVGYGEVMEASNAAEAQMTVNKAFHEARLQQAKVVKPLKSMLAKRDTLNAGEGDTLNAGEGDTLNAGEGDTLSNKFMIMGTNKSQFLSAVIDAGQTQHLVFSDIFLEACNSQLAEAELAITKKAASRSIGNIHVSSETGLRHSTIAYRTLFDRAARGDFKTAFRDHLHNVFTTQKPIPKK